MSESTEATNLTELIQTMEQMEREAPRVSVDDIVDAVGRRSFGPLLLIAGLITLAPVIGDIPGMPTLMAALVLLVSTQLLAGRKTFWLPKWLLNRSVSRKGFDKAIHALKKPAQWVDNLLGMRLKWMTGYAGIRATALACLPAGGCGHATDGIYSLLREWRRPCANAVWPGACRPRRLSTFVRLSDHDRHVCGNTHVSVLEPFKTSRANANALQAVLTLTKKPHHQLIEQLLKLAPRRWGRRV
ncbi:exopolysaccharide biosynthesis protein [Halomonas colorata]